MALDPSPDVLAPDVPERPSHDDPGTDRPPRHRWRPGRRAVVVAVVVVALTALGGWWFLLRSDDDAASGPTLVAEAVEVTTGTFGDTVSAEGTVAAASTEDLSFTSAGTVTEVKVAAGDEVVAGQVLATIDSAELEEAVASAEADLSDAEAQLADDTDAGAGDEQLEVDAAAVTTAEDALENAEEALAGASLVASFDGLVTSVDLTVGEELGSSGAGGTTVTGSGSGSGQAAGGLGAAESTTAAPGATGTESSSSPQIQVVSAGRYEVDLSVDTADIDEVAVGQDVDLTISTDTAGSTTATSGFAGGAGFGPPGGFPGASATQDTGDDQGDGSEDGSSSSEDVTATGTVTEVGRVADASSGVASYTVTVAFTADAAEVWVGSAATAEIQVAERTDVTQVSARAVTTADGEAVVTVALDGTADGPTEERTVATGETSGQMIEIVSGLEPGEFVIVESPSFGGGMPGGGELPEGFEPPSGAGMVGGAQQGGAGG